MTVSQQFYENVVANTTEPKRLTSLERVKGACDALDKQSKTKSFNLADVGRYCEKQWGGPKTQSIRNSTDILERYVKLRIAEHAESLAMSPNASIPEGKGLNLADPALAQQQYMLALAEIEQLRREVTRLKADVDHYAPMTTEQLLAMVRGDEEPAVELLPALPRPALDAIRTLLDPEKLQQCELVIDQHNYLVHEISGNELLSASQVAALQTLIE